MDDRRRTQRLRRPGRKGFTRADRASPTFRVHRAPGHKPHQLGVDRAQGPYLWQNDRLFPITFAFGITVFRLPKPRSVQRPTQSTCMMNSSLGLKNLQQCCGCTPHSDASLQHRHECRGGGNALRPSKPFTGQDATNDENLQKGEPPTIRALRLIAT